MILVLQGWTLEQCRLVFAKLAVSMPCTRFLSFSTKVHRFLRHLTLNPKPKKPMYFGVSVLPKTWSPDSRFVFEISAAREKVLRLEGHVLRSGSFLLAASIHAIPFLLLLETSCRSSAPQWILVSWKLKFLSSTTSRPVPFANMAP